MSKIHKYSEFWDSLESHVGIFTKYFPRRCIQRLTISLIFPYFRWPSSLSTATLRTTASSRWSPSRCWGWSWCWWWWSSCSAAWPTCWSIMTWDLQASRPGWCCCSPVYQWWEWWEMGQEISTTTRPDWRVSSLLLWWLLLQQPTQFCDNNISTSCHQPSSSVIKKPWILSHLDWKPTHDFDESDDYFYLFILIKCWHQALVWDD